jgi:hypothetical protein
VATWAIFFWWALPLIQWDSMPVERNPAAKEPWYFGYESSDALDPAIAEMIEALDSAWVGDGVAEGKSEACAG